MSEFYRESHEWARQEGEEIVIGLSSYAAGEVGEVIHVELPEIGDQAETGIPIAEIESVKAVNDFYSPVTGTVTAVNEKLEEQPELVNQDPQGTGWFFKLKPAGDDPFAGLLDQAAYDKHIG